ncbi:MAG: tRNA (adenosine(37)-N6)-threonylcarbamoyltransferase complex transferase subunit TsaD [Campylobacterales bacterium]
MILSIESSCDDSAIALTHTITKELIWHKKISQDKEHARYGGVVPELAARLHTEALPRLLEEIKGYLPDVKAIAVTNRPGLSVTLLEGVVMAKTLAGVLDRPLIGINHLIGHVYSLFIGKEAIFPLSVLLLSGGHSMILEMETPFEARLVATTMDDSFGESFDKVAKMMGLGYPGGPVIEVLARKGDCNAIDLPRPLLRYPGLAFSFSGLKNAVRMALEKRELSDQERADLAASFQVRAIDHVARMMERYLSKKQPTHVAVVGGASANLALRDAIATICNRYHAHLLLAEIAWCSDNAAMIGRAAIPFYEAKKFDSIENLQIFPRSELN